MIDGYMPSKRSKVLVAVGTRPEAIKVLPLIRALADNPRLEPVVVATGQHPDIVEKILALDGLAPDINLQVGSPGITLNELFSRVLTRFEEFYLERFGATDAIGADRDYHRFPVACVVHGDTSSAAAMAVACFHLQLPVIHLEAGLRTSDIRSPFPEELNRQIISRIAAFHLAPTAINAQNLVRENVPIERVFVTGNTTIDALQWAAGLEEPYKAPELAWLEDDADTPVVVVTAHRRENWGRGLDRIGDAIATLATRFPEVSFVVPVHPNPQVARALHTKLDGQGNIVMVPPLAYREFARLLLRACLALSDSGGVQEEAPAMGTPVLVMRETTERQEGVDAGTLKLVGTDVEKIVEMASVLLRSPAERRAMTSKVNPYGDGHAAERIVKAFEHIAFAATPPAPFGSGFNRGSVLRAGGFDRDPRAGLLNPEEVLEQISVRSEPQSSKELLAEILQN